MGPVSDDLGPTPGVAAAPVAVQNGAAIVRVHDVLPTVDALKVWAALR